MKFRRTVSSLIVSIVLICVVLFAVLRFDVAGRSVERLQNLITELLPDGSNGLEVRVDFLDSTLMKGVALNGISLRVEGLELLSVGKVEVSASIWDLIRITAFGSAKDLNVQVYDVHAHVTDATVGALSKVLASFGGDSGTETEGKAGTSSIQNRLGFSASVRNAYADIDYLGLRSVVYGITASAEVERGLVLKDAVVNVPAVILAAQALGSELVTINDIRFSLEPDLSMYASIASVAVGDLSSARNISAIARLSDGMVSGAANLESVSFDGQSFLVGASETTASFSYGIQDSELSFEITNELASFESESLTATARTTSAMGLLQDKALSIQAGMGNLGADLSGIGASVTDLIADFDLNLSTLGLMGQVDVSRANLNGLADYGFDSLGLRNGTIDISQSSAGVGVRLRSSVSGSGLSEMLGDFGADIDVGFQLSGEGGISSIFLNATELFAASLSEKARFSISVDSSSSMDGSLAIGEGINSSINYNGLSGEAEMRIYATDVRPSYSVPLFEKLKDMTSAVTVDSAIDGSLIVSTQLTDSFSAWFRNLVSGDFSAMPEADGVFDVLSDGRISLNSAVRGIHVGDSDYSGAVTLETNINERVADISTLAVTAMGMRISYSGLINLEDMYPNGRLSLQSATDGSELASFDFSYLSGEQTYNFILQSPIVPDTFLEGSVNWKNALQFVGDLILVEPHVAQSGMDLSFSVSLNPVAVVLTGEKIGLGVSVDDDLVHLNGVIDDLEISTGEDGSVVASTRIEAAYSIKDSSYSVSLTDLFVQVSDILDIGFDFTVSNEKLFLENLYIGRKDAEYLFDGSVDITYSDLFDIVRGDTSSIEGVINLSTEDGTSFARGSAIQDQYSFEFRYLEHDLVAGLSILGSRESDFYGQASLEWGEGGKNGLYLNGVYSNGVLSFYNTKGNMGNLRLSNLDLVVDFINMLFDGSAYFINEQVIQTGETRTQSGTLLVGGRIESLATSLFQIFAGLDYQMEFNVGLSDVRLADGYRIADTQAKILFGNGRFDIVGNLINGSYDIRSGYMDISVDKGFLFGFNAQGYVGKEIDLMVNDIYLPLPLANQLIDTAMFRLVDGILEGDILVQGSLKNLSFYGMAYCQSFAMTMFYLPEQLLSVKNVSISLQDHTIAMTRSALTGYSDLDGRYSYGTVALELILQGMGLESVEVSLDIDEQSPIDFWMPINLGATDFELRGDVSGKVKFGFSGGRADLWTDINLSQTLIDFTLGEMPDWFYRPSDTSIGGFDIELNVTTGQDIEFYYPDKDNSFLNFTLLEGKTFRFGLSDGQFSTDGGVALKSGQVYYFHNDFIIRDGSVDLSQKNHFGDSSAIPFVLNLTAELTDYDSNGNKVVIDLILQDSTLDNISPRFASTPSMSQNDILAMLGESILSSSSLDSKVSMASIASLARTARDTLTRVGVLESNSNYSISSTIRNALGLDIFSARSNIISNVIVDALPGELSGKGDVSMLARYLDGTSVYAGKYLGSDLFAKVTLMLKADSSASMSNDVGHFLAKDLILDTEISIDLDNPMGTFTIFTRPHELSVFDILDTIGFSVTKQFKF